MLNRIAVALAFAVAAVPLTAQAQGVKPVRPLPGAECRSVRETAETRAGNLPVALVEPRRGAPAAGEVGATVLAVPNQRSGGFVGVVLPDGRPAWLDERWTAPWRVASNPDLTCQPVLLSNGRVGFTAR